MRALVLALTLVGLLTALPAPAQAGHASCGSPDAQTVGPLQVRVWHHQCVGASVWRTGACAPGGHVSQGPLTVVVLGDPPCTVAGAWLGP